MDIGLRGIVVDDADSVSIAAMPMDSAAHSYSKEDSDFDPFNPTKVEESCLIEANSKGFTVLGVALLVTFVLGFCFKCRR